MTFWYGFIAGMVAHTLIAYFYVRRQLRRAMAILDEAVVRLEELKDVKGQIAEMNTEIIAELEAHMQELQQSGLAVDKKGVHE